MDTSPQSRPEPVGRIDLDPGRASIACASCGEAADPYFVINGTSVCEPCRRAIAVQLGGRTGLGRLVRSTAYGVGAAAVGTSLFAAALYYSPVDLSPMSVAVGFLVGKVVRKGGGGRGGLASQVLAVVITYLSLATAYLAVDLLDFFATNPDERPLLGRPGFYLVCLRNLPKIPVHRATASPILLVFDGFAAWQAWRLNRRRSPLVTGPHRAAEGRSSVGGLAGTGGPT